MIGQLRQKKDIRQYSEERNIFGSADRAEEDWCACLGLRVSVLVSMKKGRL
jgi:hypothetical protein